MKFLSTLLAALLLCTWGAPVTLAGTSPEAKTAARAEKVKTAVRKLGVGEAARVEVRLQDGTKLKGYVREANEDGFVIVNAKSGAASAVAYAQVRQAAGNNLSTGAKIAIGFGIAAVVLLTLVLIGLNHAD